MRLCVACKHSLVPETKLRSMFFIGPVVTQEHPALCNHPDFVDPITGEPKYGCRVLRDNNMPCSPGAKLYVPRGGPDAP